MKNYRAVVQYEGSRYDGWQKQKNTDQTIQGKLEMVLGKMTGSAVEVQGSGRTDAGVHAFGQVCNFKIETQKTGEDIRNYLNHYLPDDIGVLEVKEVPMRFHSRLNAVGKKYMYRVRKSPIPAVFERRCVYEYTKELDLQKMKEAADLFIGKHDFKAFCSNKHVKKSTVREIYEIDIYEVEGEVRFLYYGNGFLYNMVRILTGTLLEIGEGKRRAEEIPSLFAKGERDMAGFTAPACGLTLLEVEYEGD
jgi:tRNA pseudouridine38-40 synthase